MAHRGLAAALHRGNIIYHTKAQCVSVLEAVEASKPSWYDSSCAQFLKAVQEVPTFSSMEPTHGLHPLIVLEGLDGTGKTTVAMELTKRLPASLVRTPNPKYEKNVREKYRNLPEPISRAFYCAANYLAAEEAQALRRIQPVLFDRWWGSTCSMALGTKAGHANALPPVGSDVYKWPVDLPMPSHGVVLEVDEEVRRKRAELRGDMKPEEHALAAKAELRTAVNTVYERMNFYSFLHEPTWPLAVNAIIEMLESTNSIQKGKARRCTSEEIAAVKPY